MARPKQVQAMLDEIRKSAEYHEGVPKHWMRPEHGQEYALLAYVAKLEATQAPARLLKRLVDHLQFIADGGYGSRTPDASARLAKQCGRLLKSVAAPTRKK